MKRRGNAGKFFVLFLLIAVAAAGFFCWQHFNLNFNYINRILHGQLRAKAGHATTVAAAAKPAPATAPSVNPKAVAKSNHPIAAKAATAGLADSMMAAIEPSARAETVQPEMQPVSKQAAQDVRPASQKPLQTAAVAPVAEPPPLTEEQKREKVAEDGFGNVVDMAIKYPDAYGFLPGERMNDTHLGDAIPVQQIGLPDGARYTGQPVSSLLKPADEWFYPIILNNTVRYMILVKSDGHGDYVLGNGSRSVAMAYNKIVSRWPADKGFHVQLMMAPGLPFYYFSIPELPNPNITDTDRMLDLDPSLSPASIVLANCR